MFAARECGRRPGNHHHRGPGWRRGPAPRASRLARARCAAMRLLPERNDHGGGGTSRGEAGADRRRHRRCHHQHLPLRHLPAHPSSHPRHRRPTRQRDEVAMSRAPHIDRRSFLAGIAAAGGALALGFDIPFGTRAAGASKAAPEITAWIVIEPDDSVIIRVAKSEMGQGALTALPMLVAEELECDWSKVKAEFAPPHENRRRKRVWGNMSTGASRSIATSQNDLRRAGAVAREMLIAAAAARWNVPGGECTAANSVITHVPSGRTITFGGIASAAAEVTPPAKVALKDPKDWKLIGTPQRRFDIADKVTGKPIYAIDVRLPDMLYAAIAHCPVFKGTLRTVDESKLVHMKGIHRVVKQQDF